MNDNGTRYVVGGAAIGAVVGAVVGLVMASRLALESTDENGVVAQPQGLSLRRMAPLAGSVVAVVRQVLELSD